MNGKVKDGIVKRGNTWSYVIRVSDSTGASKPRWVGGFQTEQAAKTARDEARVAARRGEYVSRSGVTVQQYLTAWLKGHALEIKPKTHEDYRRLLEGYVYPRLGRMRLQSLRPATLTDFYRTLHESGGKGGRPLSPRTVGYVHAVLRKALNDAVLTDQLIPSNPALRAKRPRVDTVPQLREIWNADELTTFLGLLGQHRLTPFFHLAAFTGMRRGELLYLRWADVHLDGSDPHIVVRGSAVMVGGHRVEGTTKSGRTRTVSIDPGTVAVLRRHARQQRKERAKARGSWVENDLVFRKEIGEPLSAMTVNTHMRRVLDTYNAEHADSLLPTIRLHDLRHVHATLLLKDGEAVHVVAARLGHADPAITLRVYAHVLRDQATHAGVRFAAVLAAVSKAC